MKTKKPIVFLICLASLFAACTGVVSDTEKAADNLTKTIEDATKNGENNINDAINQLEDLAKNLQKDGDGNVKKPVNFRKLKNLLPENANGFEKTNAKGESTGAMGFNISQVEAKYEKGDKKVELNIVDAGGIGTAIMGMASWSVIQIDKESDTGFERTTTYKGRKAFEKCNNKRCEFALIIANRFIVTSKGRNVDIEDLHDLVEEVGLDDLESMKDEEG